MSNNNSEQALSSQNVIIENRGKAEISGVKDVISFDDETLLLLTNQGKMTIKGENMRIVGFNNESGDFSCEGKIHAVVYMSDLKSGGFMSRLLK